MKYLILISVLVGSTAMAQYYVPPVYQQQINQAQQNPLNGQPNYNNPMLQNNGVPLNYGTQPFQQNNRPMQPNQNNSYNGWHN